MSKTKEQVLRTSRITDQQDLVRRIQGANRKRTIVHRVPKPETLLGVSDERIIKDMFFNQLRRCFNFKSVNVFFDVNPEGYKLVERQLLTFDRPRGNTGEPWDAINQGKEWLASVLADLFLNEKNVVGLRVTSQGIIGLFDGSKKFSRVRKATKEDLESDQKVLESVAERYHQQQVEKALQEAKLRGLPEDRAKALLERADVRSQAYREKIRERAKLLELGEEIPGDTFSMWLEFLPTYTKEYNNIERGLKKA